MPTRWTGTYEDRLARLDQSKRRCDGNSRRCALSATTVYTLAPAQEWEPIPGAEHVTKQSCSRHVQQFINNPNWIVVTSKRLPSRPAGKTHPHTMYDTDSPNQPTRPPAATFRSAEDS